MRAVGPAVLVAVLAACAPAGAATSPYGAGCDPALPVVAHHAGGRTADMPAPRPVACAVDTGYASSESSIAITNGGAVLYSPAQTENSLTRSLDDGAGWSLAYPPDEQFTALWNTVDPQLAVDRRTGRAFWIHATGQLRTAPVLVSGSPLPWELTTAIAYASGFQVYSSADDGRHWRTADYANEPMGDWEKVFAGPAASPASGAPQPRGYPGVVYACANSPFEVSGPGRLCYRSLDGGVTFGRAGYVFPSPGSPVDSCPALATNTGVVGSDGTVYQPVSCSQGAYVAVSHDEGATYAWFRVTGAPPSSGIAGSLQIVLDAADDVYAVWQDGEKLFLATSRDRARTWGPPRDVTAPGVHGLLFPAPAAGGRGQVGITYYGTREQADTLTAYATVTQDVLADAPLFYSAALNDPAHPVFHDYDFDATPRADYIGAAYDPSGTFWSGAVRQLGKPDAENRIATSGLVGRLLFVADDGAPAPGGAALSARGKPAACVASRRLVFRLGRVPGGRVVRAVVHVNGRRVLTRRGRRLTRVSVRRPAGRRIVVRIVTTNDKRGRVITVRSYRGCARSPLRARHVRHGRLGRRG